MNKSIDYIYYYYFPGIVWQAFHLTTNNEKYLVRCVVIVFTDNWYVIFTVSYSTQVMLIYSLLAYHYVTYSQCNVFILFWFQDAHDYSPLLAEARVDFMNLFEMDGWKHEGGKDLVEGMIYSQNVKKYGRKIFKLKVRQSWVCFNRQYTVQFHK